MQEIASEVLPADVRLSLRGEAASLKESQSGTVMVFGTAPLVVLLVLASGAGAEARLAVGWVIAGGLGFATVFTLFLTPLFYRLIAPPGGEPGREMRQLAEETAAMPDQA